jgi:hypothetical protein
MAALTNDQIGVAFKEGTCEKTALYTLKNVSAADTVDLAGEFKVVKRAGIVSASGTTIAAVSTITSNTVCTIPTGPANDGVWLLVCGVAA